MSSALPCCVARAIRPIEFEKLRENVLDIGPYTVPQDKNDLFTVSYKTLASLQAGFKDLPKELAEDRRSTLLSAKLLLYEDAAAHEAVSRTLDSLCKAHVLWQRAEKEQKPHAQFTFDVLMRLLRHKAETWIKSVYRLTKDKCSYSVDDSLETLETLRSSVIP